MQTSLEIALREQIRKSDFKTLVVFFFAVASLSAAISSWGLYFTRLGDSTIVINCASFVSQDDATAFSIVHPQYKKRLNPLNKAQACTSHDYGTTN